MLIAFLGNLACSLFLNSEKNTESAHKLRTLKDLFRSRHFKIRFLIVFRIRILKFHVIC